MPVITRNSRRDWTDIAGFIFYLLLAGSVLLRLPKVGVLLLPMVLHESLVAASFLIRRPLRGRAHGILPRVAAYSSTFLLLGFLEFARRFHPDWLVAPGYLPMKITGLAVWAFGSFLSLWTVWWLRNSFSVEPQARTLVTCGPFRFARHPTYGGYMLEYLGFFLINPTLPIAAAVLAWFGVTCLRIHYEERVLTSAFPAYADYRSRVGAFGLRFRRVPAAEPGRATAVAAGQEHAA